MRRFLTIAAELECCVSRPISRREISVHLSNRLPVAQKLEERMFLTPKKLVPRVVIGHRDPAYAALLGQQLAGVGWEPVTVDSAAQARAFARAKRTVALLLDVDLQDESGWLTCDKMTRERPELCVVLISKDTRPENQRFATFVGARALVRQQHDAGCLPRAFRACREAAGV
jgi:CheY-like chemotaxis protein